MKLNKTRLKQLIQEELQAALSEQTDAEQAHARKLDTGMREIVAKTVKSMNSYGNIISLLQDLVGTYSGDDAKIQEISGVTEQDLRKVILLNQKIVEELDDIYTQMSRQVKANKAGTTPSPYGMTEK